MQTLDDLSGATKNGNIFLSIIRTNNLSNCSGVDGTFPLQHSGYASCAMSVKEGREVVVTGGDAVGGIAHQFVDR